MAKAALLVYKTGAPNTDNILDSLTDGVLTVDGDWRITSFNHAAETLTGVARAEALGHSCRDIIRSSACNGDCPLRRTIETGTPVSDLPAQIYRQDGGSIPIYITTTVLHDNDGATSGGVETIRVHPHHRKSSDKPDDADRALSLREIESLAIIEALRRNRGNKTATARELMIERSTLYRKIRDYGITEA